MADPIIPSTPAIDRAVGAAMDSASRAADGTSGAMRTNPVLAIVCFFLAVIVLGFKAIDKWGPPTIVEGTTTADRDKLDGRLGKIEDAQHKLAESVARIEGALGIKKDGDK